MVWLNARKIRICEENNLFQYDGLTSPSLLIYLLNIPSCSLCCPKGTGVGSFVSNNEVCKYSVHTEKSSF